MPVSEREVWAHLEQMAPLHFAERWDNVGLLVQPSAEDREIARLMLTVDLTAAVMSEAIASGSQAILAYHPPIFSGLKKLRAGHGQESVIVDAMLKGMSIYSPHTALDAAQGGVADWLADLFGAATTREVIASADNSAEEPTGPGRIVTLDRALSLADVMALVKGHLGVEHLRVATSDEGLDQRIERVAICPGAGGSLFAPLAPVAPIDLFFTGEMRHHDVLDKVRGGAAVILTEHTNCERGYLPILAGALGERFGTALDIACAATDRDPLRVA